jgi:hypothetical protein
VVLTRTALHLPRCYLVADPSMSSDAAISRAATYTTLCSFPKL